MAKSTETHRFSNIPKADIDRSKFDMSCGHKTTFNAGELIPFFLQEVLPGDTFDVSSTLFGRLATPINPIMDNMKLDTHYFFVPNRLVWDNWQKFNGEQDNPGDSTDFTVPVLSDQNAVGTHHLFDYFGLPINVPLTKINVLPFRAYNLIYNEWYRDQNLIDSIPISKGDGPDSSGTYNVQKRGKRFDYFTSSLIAPQKGEAIPLPSATDFEITPDQVNAPLGFKAADHAGGQQQWSLQAHQDNIALDIKHSVEIVSSDGNPHTLLNADKTPLYWDADNIGLSVTASSNGATINDLRRAFALQKLSERDARGGTRYTEIIKAHWNVTSPDSRLQRPEYLGGGSASIAISPIQQTSSTDSTTPQGNLAAQGTVESHRNGFTKSFTEHGFIIGILSARADLTYQQGINRLWSRRTRFDYAWPALAHIGEQAVLNKEIYVDGTKDDDLTFGYQERYAEYRVNHSILSGLFRSAAQGTLDSWHLAQNFKTRPGLNKKFIEENVPVDRVVAVTTEPDFIMDIFNAVYGTRALPTYGDPGFLDHF